MDVLPIQFLHIETLITPLFLAMMLYTQMSRTTDPGYFVQGGTVQWKWLTCIFLIMVLSFSGALANVSLLLALELAIGCTLALMHPANALCLYVHMLYLRPWEIVVDNPLLLALPRLLALLCFFSWLMHFRQHAVVSARAKRGLRIVIAFCVWLLMSSFITPSPGETQSDFFQGFFKTFILFLMSLYFLEGERSITQLQLTLVISTLGLMSVGGFQFYIDHDTAKRLSSVGGLSGDPNDMSLVVVMSLPLAFISVFTRSAGMIRQLQGLLYAFTALLVIWFSKSRGALLSMAGQIMILPLFLRSKARMPLFIIMVVCMGAGYGVMMKALPRESGDMSESSQSRVIYWKTAVNMAVHHPVFGVGFDQYPVNFDAYSSGPKFEFGVRTCHSSWFLAFAESGFVGGGLFVAFFITVLGVAWRNRRRHPEHLLSIVGYGIGMSFLSHTYSMYYYLLCGLILSSDIDDGPQHVS